MSDYINLRDVIMYVNSGDYQGEAPTTIEVKKALDIAVDTSCNKFWQYDGYRWLPYTISSVKQLYLGEGRTIDEKLESTSTTMTGPTECFSGASSDIPEEFQYSEKDLAIHHYCGDLNPKIVVSRLDRTSGVYHNVGEPLDVWTTTDGDWSLVRSFACLVGYSACTVTIQSSVIAPGGTDDSGSDYSDVYSKTEIDTKLTALEDSLTLTAGEGLELIDNTLALDNNTTAALLSMQWVVD